MSILNVENVSHGFGARKILENVSFRMLKGEHIALVGANGEGKSTFLNIITGKLAPDVGDVSWCNHITTGFLDQSSTLTKGKTIRETLHEAFENMYSLESEMLKKYEIMGDCEGEELDELMEDVGVIQDILETGGFYMLDSRIEEYANGLGLGDIGLDRDVSELSGGQRTKVLLTKLLLENPMVLLLDEPTNYLDENHINWLTNFLQNYENAFMLVSHDVNFLNKVVNIVYHVEDGILNRYKGDYTNFEQMYQLKKRQIEQAYEKQQKEIEHLEKFIAKNKARVATTNMAKSRQKKLDKMEIIELAPTKMKPIFSFEYARTPGRFLIDAQDIQIGYDEPLTKPMKLQLERGKKIAIKGVNGLGKSTLLKTLLKIIPSISGEIDLDPFVECAYFEQEANASNKTAMQTIWDLYPSLTNAQVRASLAKCGLTTMHIESQMKVLSGGENAKVRLCALMMRASNLLVLDEPTNHLDVDAKDSLKTAIKNYKGTVLLVSHEPEFYEDIVTDVWNLEQWTNKII
ncbi:MAG: ABC-F family ATP-binding cassette domain-containing protein [Clostridia bacterium]